MDDQVECPTQEMINESISCDDVGGPFFYSRKKIADNVKELRGWIRTNGYFPDIYHVNDHGNVSLMVLQGNHLHSIQGWV